jgi:hypothetical protein
MKLSDMSREDLENKVEAAFNLLLEARDALPAISLSSARLHNVSLSLADRIEGWLEPWKIKEPKPLGASELFFVQKLNPGVYMLACNYFNYNEEFPVPFQIVIAQENSFKGFYGDVRPTKPYMLDPNKIVATANSVMDKHQKILGTLTVSDKGCTFAFSEMDMGNSRTLDPDKEYVKQTQQYLHDFYNDSVRLKDVLIDAGAIIAYDKEHVPPKTEFIDLSIENIQKDTILSLLS